MNPLVFRCLLPVVALLTVACAPSPDVGDFDNGCTTAEDCVGVYTGDPCSGCQCADAAIAQSALDDWQAARGEPFCPVPAAEQCLCAAPLLSCEDGTCAIE